jgi:hypothetical protein
MLAKLVCSVAALSLASSGSAQTSVRSCDATSGVILIV